MLVNNAGVGYFGSFEESDLSEARRMFEINVWGLTAMSRDVLPGMRHHRSDRVGQRRENRELTHMQVYPASALMIARAGLGQRNQGWQDPSQRVRYPVSQG